jgi:hypothetical protein
LHLAYSQSSLICGRWLVARAHRHESSIPPLELPAPPRRGGGGGAKASFCNRDGHTPSPQLEAEAAEFGAKIRKVEDEMKFYKVKKKI